VGLVYVNLVVGFRYLVVGWGYLVVSWVCGVVLC